MTQRINIWTSWPNKDTYLCQSRSHVYTVGLVKNLQTGKITPQYHLTFDEKFTTVDDNIINDNYKQKLLTLIDWNKNTDQTQTNKLTSN